MPGNPVPMFAAWMIMAGMVLCLGGVLYFMVLGMETGGEEETFEPPIFATLIGILLIIIGVWTIVDMGRKQKKEGE